MTMTALLNEARALKPRQRVTLINKLLALDPIGNGGKADAEEMIRRIEEVKSGRASLDEGEWVMRHARKIAGISGKPPRLPGRKK